jgi:hypothetical protein
MGEDKRYESMRRCKADMRSTDIIAAIPEKSGTTWLQHMAHQLRAKGAEPDFECQNDVRLINLPLSMSHNHQLC